MGEWGWGDDDGVEGGSVLVASCRPWISTVGKGGSGSGCRQFLSLRLLSCSCREESRELPPFL